LKKNGVEASSNLPLLKKNGVKACINLPLLKKNGVRATVNLPLGKERCKGNKEENQESLSTSLEKDRGRHRKKIVKTLSTEEVDDIFN
jgi:hypothetical protein